MNKYKTIQIVNIKILRDVHNTMKLNTRANMITREAMPLEDTVYVALICVHVEEETGGRIANV